MLRCDWLKRLAKCHGQSFARFRDSPEKKIWRSPTSLTIWRIPRFQRLRIGAWRSPLFWRTTTFPKILLQYLAVEKKILNRKNGVTVRIPKLLFSFFVYFYAA